MKTAALFLASALPTILAQSLPPSLTESVGCEPHGDHWHCPSGVPEPTTPPAVTASESHDHDDDDHTIPLTASGACEPHGDHWHCSSGVSEPLTPPPATATHSDDDHDNVLTGTASCEPHGDHWHCPSGIPEPTTPPAAAATTTRAANGTSGASSATPSQFDGRAGSMKKSGALGVAAGLFAAFLA
ncbi:hypothetical protein K469DRAFT_710151 [Zopfia rhizophila CBS 207.26]|uniref:Uncharacterized protein n=1 Tax=Zopfia rhizophila CBS 207.26 TaxID=1314779 RepID=A0A6A6DXM6_9PEZI|nr:hypothetical protein K469DRAFT_710151 [Zopfia rhizophila CBS 207.26]